MRTFLLGAVVGALVFAGMPVLAQPRVTFRVIDGDLAKLIEKQKGYGICTQLWMDNEEVLLVEYRSHTFLLRTGFGDIGRGCRL